MSERQEDIDDERRPPSDVARGRLNTATAACYLVALGVLMVRLFGMWTHVFDGERLSMAYGLFSSYILPYAVWLLFSVLLLDIYANGIRLQKALTVAIGVILLAAACMGGRNDELIYFFWLIAAYPQKLNLRKAAVTLLAIGGLLTAITIAFALTDHIASNPVYDAWGVARSVGFTSPGKFCAVATSLIMIWVWWKTRTWRWVDVCIAAVAAILVFVVGHDAVALASCLLQVLLTSLLVSEKLVVGVRRGLGLVVGFCARWGFAALGALTLVFFILASPRAGGRTFALLDGVSGGFLGQLLSSYDAAGLTAFGRAFDVASTCESTYLAALLACGVVGFAGVATLFVMLMGKGAHAGRVETSVYLLAFLVLGCTHSLLFWPLVNFAVLAIGEALARTGAERGSHSRGRIEGERAGTS